MRHTILTAALLGAISLTSVASARAANFLTTTYQGYNPGSGTNNLSQKITYALPDATVFGPGPYPVFVWVPGSFEVYNDPMAQSFMNAMVLQGFLVAAVQYNNTDVIQTCNTYTTRAQSIFTSTSATSAVGVLCKLTGAACSKGIVTAGASQGGMLAVLAKNYAPNVAATYAMSVSDYEEDAHYSLAACMDKANTAIPADRLMIVNGAADTIFGGQTALQNVSGYSCAAGTSECWSPSGNGAGWYIVQNSEVTDGTADHCYYLVGGCTGTSFDPNWFVPAMYNWSLTPNLMWLASFGTERLFSSSGELRPAH